MEDRLKKATIFALLSFALVAGTLMILAPQPRSAMVCKGQNVDRPTAAGSQICRVRFPLGQAELAHRSAAPANHRS
jgi:hypothetical protein